MTSRDMLIRISDTIQPLEVLRGGSCRNRPLQMAAFLAHLHISSPQEFSEGCAALCVCSDTSGNQRISLLVTLVDDPLDSHEPSL